MYIYKYIYMTIVYTEVYFSIYRVGSNGGNVFLARQKLRFCSGSIIFESPT